LSIKFVLPPFLGLVLACCLSISTAAQQTPPPPNPDSSSQAPSKDTGKDATTNSQTQGQSTSGNSSSASSGNQGKVTGTSKDRLFYALPNFLTLENGGKLPPLTAKQKFKVVALGTFDPVQYPWWGLVAAVSQAENSEPAFGQGWVGYAKRYGATAADSTIENFMVGAVFPSILHQDPRFYQSDKGGFARRTWYAVTRILVTRGDSGNKQFNFSEVFGSALAATISTYSYHPSSTYISTASNQHMFIGSDKTLANTASVWGTQVGLDTITIVVKEFWPDVHRKLSHKHQDDTTPATAPNP
jgi:hypothetical protein